jgi:DNA-directed RNA polymerase subunit H (RpoH/RPB5)
MSWKENIGKSFKTLKEMLEDRHILDDNELGVLQSMTEKEILAFTEKKSIFNIDIGNKVRVIYYLQQFKKQDFIGYIEDDNQFELYIVIYKKLTTNNIKVINSYEAEFGKKYNVQLDIQFFDIRELLFNITKHELVPKHEVITDEAEIEQIAKIHNVKSRLNFPLILKTDPIAKYYGIKHGNLVKITRISPSSGEYFIYRCCV